MRIQFSTLIILLFFNFRYVKSVKHQVMEGNAKGGIGASEAKKFQEKKDKKKKEEANKLLASLFKGAQNLADQKEAAVDAKTINMYKDPRTGTEDMPDTIITCKHFLAVTWLISVTGLVWWT